MAIKNFRSRKLKVFWENNDESKVAQEHVTKIGDILSALDASHHPRDIKAWFGRGFRAKKGNAEGVYSVDVNGNWRITFEIEDDGAILLDYCDYHGKKIKKK